MIFRVTMLAAAVVIAVSAGACVPKKDVDPSLLDGPGWTKVDNNLHQVDGPPAGVDAEADFRVYRSGAPAKETFAKWCEVYKIERVIVMSGTADKNELAYQAEGVCPDIEVVYNVKQSPMEPVSDEFLEFFDQEIERAREDRAGILFRCETGSHRAGRTAAYYQMKHQGLRPDEALAVMDYNGTVMFLFDHTLHPQVRAMHDHMNGKPCSVAERYCVEDSNKWAP